MQTLCVGVDVAKATLAVAYWDGERSQALGSFPNGRTETQALVARLRELATAQGATAVRLVVEPTGGYEAALAVAAYRAGWEVWLPNPLRVKRFGEGRGKRGKTDAADAALLACFAVQGSGTPWQPLPQAVQQLDQLLTRQAALEELGRQETNRCGVLGLAEAVPAAVTASFTQLAEAITTAQAALAQAVAELVATEPTLAAASERLQTVPGVGEKTVLPLLVLLERFRLATAGAGSGAALTAYVGLDPQSYQSGTSIYRPPHISRRGDGDLRRRLFCAAAGGERSKTSALGAFFRRLQARGKPWKLATVACARKLLCWAWAVHRSGEPFDPARAAARQLPAA